MSKESLPRVVVVLGLVSFCNDFASEMVTPLIPVLLAAVLGAGPVTLGFVEGLAEAIAAWFKLWSGRRSDLWGGRRKPFILGGYSVSNLVRPLLGLATSWGMVAGLRALERVGKGLRSAPRDALVGDVTPAGMRGRAYGLHRALDNGGAMAGALLAAACLTWTPLTLTQIMLLSALPGLAGVVLVAFAVRDAPAASPVQKTTSPPSLPPLAWRQLAPHLRSYLLILALFTLARASETFVVLRGHELQMTVPLLLLLWAAMSLAKALAAWFGGRWSDRFGHRRLVLLNWLTHGASFLLLACVQSPPMLWVAALVYGLFAGLGEGAERALVGELSESGAPSQRGTSFGWYNLVLGVAAIPAGLLFGSVWQTFGAATAFSLAGLLAWLAAALLQRKVFAL